MPRREETYETAKDFFSQAHHRRCAVGHRHLRVMRAVSDKPTEYLELSDAGGGRFSTPTTPGLYFYKVRAEWSGRGFIQYYFALQVRELQI